MQRAAAEGTVRCIMDRKDFIDLMNGSTPSRCGFRSRSCVVWRVTFSSTNSRLTELAAPPSCRLTLDDPEEVFPQ